MLVQRPINASFAKPTVLKVDPLFIILLNNKSDLLIRVQLVFYIYCFKVPLVTILLTII